MANSDSRNGFLDLLRASAIAMVVNCHIASTIRSEMPGSDGVLLRSLGIGGHGVDLFFVLSGWLLGGMLFRELDKKNGIDLKRFYGRRWLRTLPAYYTVLLVALAQRFFNGNFGIADLSYFGFIQTYKWETMPFFGVSWSLCVEEHFYLLIAPLILYFGRTNRSVVVMFALLIAVPTLCRAFGWYGSLSQTHVRLDQCAMGVALAGLRLRSPIVWQHVRRWSLALAGVASILFLFAFYARGAQLNMEYPLAVYTLIFSAWVALSDRNQYWTDFGKQVRAFHYLSTRSYALYLVHIEAISVANYLNIQSPLFFTVAVWAAGLILAEALYRLIEVPGMAMRELIAGLRSTSALNQPDRNRMEADCTSAAGTMPCLESQRS